MVTLDDLKTPKKNTWCPGCGNFGILMAFKKALIQLALERDQVAVVSGIGCHGKMVNYVNVNGFHGIHGRSLPLATGIKLANPNLTVVCFAGDADCYDEGWGHFSHAVRRNIDLTLIVHNNMVLGLTTGQTTATSQKGFRSKSTPFGSIPPALNPVAHALVSNGTFVGRGYSGDMLNLTQLMVAALQHRGFSFLDVLQPCVTFNYLNTYDWFKERVYRLEEEDYDATDRQNAIKKSFEWGNRIPTGVFYREERPTFIDGLPQLKDQTLAKASIEKAAITSLLENMT
jgi:2-oxoglutarate ferredoxin oxidoreductase subunit beta